MFVLYSTKFVCTRFSLNYAKEIELFYMKSSMFFYIPHSKVFNRKLMLLILSLLAYVYLDTYNYLLILMGSRKNCSFVCAFKEVTSCRGRILY